jgi:phosphate transport system substrate-binding protein
LLILAVVTPQVDATAAELSGRLIISGSDAMEQLVNDLASGFMKTHKNVKIIVRGGESGMGISEIRSDTASIGMVSRILTPEESLDLRSYTIAYEGICFVTSPKNPVKDISMAQLKEVLLGRNSNWKNIGGNDLPINCLIPYRKSASNKIVAEFLGVQVADLKGTEISDYETGIKSVSRDPRALFYVSTGKAFYEKLNGMPFNILSVSGKKANMVSIAQNRYPLTRSLNFITKGEPNPLAKAFIEYCLSPSVTHTIRSHYFIKPQ